MEENKIHQGKANSAEVIADSIGPNGKRITTLRIYHPRMIHAELLRHRLFSFSVASSRAIPYPVQRKQVEENPVMPIMWQKAHRGMQGNEIFGEKDGETEDPYTHLKYYTVNYLNHTWKDARTSALSYADQLDGRGVSKQLLNRLIEPWVSTRCIVTATEWDNFFMLRHPWHYEDDYEDVIIPGQSFTSRVKKVRTIVWETEPNLNFPAEVHIQELAILMKQAMDSSTPQVLKAGEWHLPFVSEDEKVLAVCGLPEPEMTEAIKLHESKLVKLSAARCAFTSYDKNAGKSIEQELATAASLIKDHHWSPFEHQAKAIPDWQYKLPKSRCNFEEGCQDLNLAYSDRDIYKGLEIRSKYVHMHGIETDVWSRNFKEWCQARALLDS